MVVATETAVLLAVAAAAVIYAIGLEETKQAATTVGGKTKRAATSTAGAGLMGAGIGMQLGAEIIQAGMAEPFAVTTIIAGVAGALGIGGVLEISGLQFLLIGITFFVAVVVFGGDN